VNEAATTTQQQALRLERRYDAPPEAVFDAWTNPEVLRRWWAAGPDWETARAEVDLRPGGRYRLTMRDPAAGAEHTVGGEYVEVRRPDRLTYTWAWEPEPDGPDMGPPSTVTVDFVADGGGTRVELLHSGLAGEQSRAHHEHGWHAVLDNLGNRVFA
jgi:uncharacterized protein YndB with AHSA1/START domain